MFKCVVSPQSTPQHTTITKRTEGKVRRHDIHQHHYQHTPTIHNPHNPAHPDHAERGEMSTWDEMNTVPSNKPSTCTFQIKQSTIPTIPNDFVPVRWQTGGLWGPSAYSMYVTTEERRAGDDGAWSTISMWTPTAEDPPANLATLLRQGAACPAEKGREMLRRGFPPLTVR